jgi:ligand-binding sensor domain-containing protein
MVYLTLSNRREDDNRPYIYFSSDRGQTWKAIGDRLPPSPVNVVREDPLIKGMLYAGTDMGVYISKDQGITWTSLRANLPASVSVQDLYIHPRDGQLVIATYGRGVWVLDDVQPLRNR